MTPRILAVLGLSDPTLRARGEAHIAALVERDRLRLGAPERHTPDARRLLCGCLQPAIGPTTVRADGSCAACSP